MDTLVKRNSIKISLILGIIILVSVFLGTRLGKMSINQSVKVNVSNGIENRKVDLDNAPLQELQSLEGIGEVKAKKIIEYRKDNEIQSVYDLLNIEGIGVDTVESIKSEVIQ